MQVEGRCHCGEITYRAEVDPERVAICHCADCQMLTGSAYRATVPARAQDFVLLSGRPKTYVKVADSGQRRVHAFCSDCGSPVYSCAEGGSPPSFSLRLGCLRQRGDLPPRRQQWVRSALAWAMDLRGMSPVDRQ